MSAVPVQKPIIIARPKPQLRVEVGTRPSVGSKATARTVIFGVLMFSVFFSSSLAGQVMVEKARREGMRMIERSRATSKEVGLLRDQVQSMTRASAIDAWAQANGLVAPEALNANAQAKH